MPEVTRVTSMQCFASHEKLLVQPESEMARVGEEVGMMLLQ